MRLISLLITLFLSITLQAQVDVSYNIDNIIKLNADTRQISFTPYGNNLVVTDDDGYIQIINLEKNAEKNSIKTDHSAITASVISSEQTYIATADKWGNVEVREFEGGQLVSKIKDDEKVTALAISSDEKRLATGNSDGVIKIWNLKFAKQIMEFKNHDDTIKSLYFLPGNKFLYSASEDKTIRQWNLITKKEQRNINETSSKWGDLLDVSFSPAFIASGVTEVKKDDSNRRTRSGRPVWNYLIKLRDSTSGEEHVDLNKHIAPITNVYISKNQKYVVSASEDHTVRVWSTKNGKLLSTIPLDEEVTNVTLSPSNKWLVAATDDQKLSVFELSFIDSEAEINEESNLYANSHNAKSSQDLSQIYAVIIGISKYESEGITSLEYARADAQALYDFLTAKDGQNVPKENIKLLLDEEATLLNIKKSLGVFLAKKAKKRDTVMIFYAGHGAPETDITGSSDDGVSKYIVNYDADPDLLYATAFPMGEIKNIFKRIQSDRVALFLDSCYSGAAGGRSFLSSNLKARALRISRKFLDNNVPDGSGRVIITASRPNERSFELDTFGHGIFTYYLLDALKGSADLNRNKNITLHELYTYLEERVSSKVQDIGGAQHPMMIGTFQGNFIRLQE